ncbi:hypothetical protein WQ54_14435 [Bacillus sp. SA1-12]|uniref:class I SAM-dependent DNA methyltransferase n=1 Tax=Bacillus sp. SA1-12 TaxID=1455638 RepID=UPI0006256F07|nr:class I SAM-dependent methyltransferase [Bacillus sp. SA1-12]KKI91468.1 hypothetical protein WQ54_14435 [Bacillus sp. SA1-12]
MALKHGTEKFYDNIAEKYHWFFSSWDDVMERQMKNLVPQLRNYNADTILDCSCGTGLQAIGLAKVGFDVVGTDLSQNMLDKAQRNATEAKVNLRLLKSDLRELNSNVVGLFDAVICMGNSIPHLMSEIDLKKALKNIYNCVNQSGVAIFEMRNYDKMLSEKPRFLPMRINDEKDGKFVSVLYVFDYLEKIVRFNIVYLIEDKNSGNKSMEVESVDYNPIKSEIFKKLLLEARFKEIEVLEDDHNLQYIAKK